MDVQQIVASAVPFLGPVRLVTNQDLTLDVRAWNDRAIMEALRAAGWKGGRVAYLSTYDPRYTRTETLLAILRRNGIEVEPFLMEGRPLRLFSVLPGIRSRYDAFILGFRGHHLLPFVRMLLAGRPLLFDAFTSIHDTLCDDRRVVAPDSIAGRAIRRLDRRLCRLANGVLVDTRTNAEHFGSDLDASNVFPVYVECNEEMFHEHKPPLSRSDDSRIVATVPCTLILWYGTCQPLHGVDRILRWAKSLEGDPSIRFRLIGPVQARFGALVNELQSRNIECIDHVPYEELPAEIAAAALCLGGPFGPSMKTQRVITAKTYQMLACGKPVLVGDTPATRELFGE